MQTVLISDKTVSGKLFESGTKLFFVQDVNDKGEEVDVRLIKQIGSNLIFTRAGIRVNVRDAESLIENIIEVAGLPFELVNLTEEA